MKTQILLPSTYPVTCHTDFVQHGSVFVAIEGLVDNGVNYIVQALEKGARTIVVHQDAQLSCDILNAVQNYKADLHKTANTRQALAHLSAEKHSFPAKKLTIIGITGTKGKTTTAFLLEHILRTAGHTTALLSSARNAILDTHFSTSLTTPQPDYLHQFLATCIEHGVTHVVMEVAAQALSLHRIEGLAFDGLIFTNFSHEHLEFYATLDDYFKAKVAIFNHVKQEAPVVINADDNHGTLLLKKIAGSIGYSYNQKGHYRGVHHAAAVNKLSFDVQVNNSSIGTTFTCTNLFGLYNAYNALASVGMALQLGVAAASIQRACACFAGVPGRLEQYVLPNQARCFIDYAHNPDSFNAVLSTLRVQTDHLIVLFGAGGGRDKHKRPLMGAIAAQYADIIIITSDNPRSENAGQIAHEIMAGIPMSATSIVLCQLDRKKAIERAYALSKPSSIIALLGKGPDEYQLIEGKKSFFSEKEIIFSF